MQDAEMLEQAQRCLALWRAVMKQALQDIIGRPSRDKDKYARIHTMHWFSESDEYFLRVCDLADLQPEPILKKVGEYEY